MQSKLEACNVILHQTSFISYFNDNVSLITFGSSKFCIIANNQCITVGNIWYSKRKETSTYKEMVNLQSVVWSKIFMLREYLKVTEAPWRINRDCVYRFLRLMCLSIVQSVLISMIPQVWKVCTVPSPIPGVIHEHQK